MPTTRRQRLKHSDSLVVEPKVLVHVLSAVQRHSFLWNGDLAAAARVCQSWHDRVVGARQLEDEPDNAIGELRSGDKPYRFDRPHDVIFLP